MENTNNNGTSTIASETTTTDQSTPKLDQFGRDKAERTLELSSEDMEALNLEVIAGEHDTIDDALQYVINHGLREIKRTRDAQAKAKDARELAKKRDDYDKLLNEYPKLATDPEFVKKMIADLVHARK